MSNYYHVLSLQRTATADEIRVRFHELARKWHPDRIGNDDREVAERRFQEISEAFNVLSNPSLRTAHDKSMPAGADQARTAAPDSASKAYIQRGIRAYRDGSFAEAADSFNRATADSPSDARAWVYLARAECSPPHRAPTPIRSRVPFACFRSPC